MNIRFFYVLAKRNIQLIAIILVWVMFSSPYIFNGKTPFPSNYQVNFFQPWNVYPGMGSPVKNNAQPDIVTQIVPWRHFTVHELKSGRLPLWNPYSFAGTPHLANYQSAVLFPLNIIFFLPISFIDAWSILVLLQPLLAGLFIFMLMRQYGISKNGSFLSALSFMFCGFIVVWLGYATLGYAILFLPLALLTLLKGEKTRKLRWLILFSITFPLSFFSGHFQISLYFALAVLAFIIYQLFKSDSKKFYFKSFLFTGVGILLTMPQVLPSLELYSLSVRSGLFQKVETIPFQYLATLFSPDFFGNPVTRNDWFGHYAEWNGYTGLIALSFALFAVLFKRNQKTLFFIVLAALAMLFAVESPLQQILVLLKIPVISTSATSRIVVLFSFSVAVLAGFGFDEFVSNKKKLRIFIWGVLTLLLFASLSFAGLTSIHESDKFSIALKNSILPLAIFISLTIYIFSSFFIKYKKLLRLTTVLILIVASFEMYRFAEKWQNFDPKNRAYIQLPIANFYSSHNHYTRAVGLAGGEDAVFYQVPILTGYDPLYKEEYGEFIQYVTFGRILRPERSVVAFPYKGIYTSKALDFLGVGIVVHKISDGTFPWAFPFKDYPISQFAKIYDDSSYQVFRNNNAYQRAFIVSNVKVLPHNEIPQKMIESDLKSTAFVEDEISGIKMGSGSADILSYNPGYLKIKANATEKAFLVLTDNYYPGWKAKVNGISEKIYKTDYSFRGIKIPKGESIVEFSYVPMSFMVGIYLFLVGIMSIIIVNIMQYFSKKDE